MHLQSICDEFNNDNHTMNAEDRIHYAAELVKAATNVSKAVAKDIDITPYILQVLEIGALFAKEIDRDEEPEPEPEEVDKTKPWSVISISKADIAEPFFPKQKLHEEINILNSFDSYDDAKTYSLTLLEDHAIVSIDHETDTIKYHSIREL